MPDYFQTGAFASEQYGLSWHKKEKDIQERSLTEYDTVTSAMSVGKMLDIKVVKAASIFRLPQTDEYVERKGRYELVLDNLPAHWNGGTMQDLERRVSWSPTVQNSEYAEILDPLVTENGWRVIGVLHAGQLGEVMAIQLEMPEFLVGGLESERHTNWMLVSENRKTGVKHYGLCNTRVVCQNTYVYGIKGMVKLPNAKQPKKLLHFRTKMIQAITRQRENTNTVLNRLFSRELAYQTVDDVVTRLLKPKGSSAAVALWQAGKAEGYDSSDKEFAYVEQLGKEAQRRMELALEKSRYAKSEILTRYEQFNDEREKHVKANTAYGLWQAVTGFANHSSLHQVESDSSNFNILFGKDRARLMDDAWQAIQKA
jgi:hypothetical protein